MSTRFPAIGLIRLRYLKVHGQLQVVYNSHEARTTSYTHPLVPSLQITLEPPKHDLLFHHLGLLLGYYCDEAAETELKSSQIEILYPKKSPNRLIDSLTCYVLVAPTTIHNDSCDTSREQASAYNPSPGIHQGPESISTLNEWCQATTMQVAVLIAVINVMLGLYGGYIGVMEKKIETTI